MIVPALRAPIVLVHGLLGFNEWRVFGFRLASYFGGIPDFLSSGGNRVLVPQLSPTRGIAERAGQLRDFLDRELPNQAVHVLAHSLGGLDSRFLITRLGMASRILTLTTIGTPHRGTAFADWIVNRCGRVATPFAEAFDLPLGAICDLTRDACRSFNERVLDAPGVRYFAVAGQFTPGLFDVEWQMPFRIVRAAEGDNDGVVSIASAAFGEDMQIWDGDHLALVNWLGRRPRLRGRKYDLLPKYARLIHRLADEGY